VDAAQGISRTIVSHGYKLLGVTHRIGKRNPPWLISPGSGDTEGREAVTFWQNQNGLLFREVDKTFEQTQGVRTSNRNFSEV
jgi:hypothetical protein